MLADDKSKKIFDKIIIFRTVFAFNLKARYSKISMFFFCFKYGIIPFILLGFSIVIYTLFFRIFHTKSIRLLILFNSLFLKQCEIKNVCEAEKGDTVFDVGAFSGDSAIYFERKCGSSSKIYCFEPIYEFFKNINTVAKNVTAVNKGLGRKTHTARFNSNRLCSGMSENGDIEVSITTLDEYIKENNIEKVDFIKVDIEGGEKDMLLGTKETIVKYRPKMSIAVYHGSELYFRDFYTLPSIIKEMTPNYKYYLRHFTPWFDETFLFCLPG